jgi:CDP-diacylglycerol--serine O-phosphatidyltransferase
MNALANFLTVLSLACGFISVIFSLEGHFTFASWAIIFAVLFDGLDGQVARLNSIPSGFGKELDSLADVVSFGIAPVVLGYVFIYRVFYIWAPVALFIYLFCSVMRLAKYNITPKETLARCFYGLPTTISGGVLASFILIYRKKQGILLPEFIPFFLQPEFIPVIFIFLVLILSFLMVSRVRYLNLDGLKELLGKKTGQAIFLLAVLLLAAGFFRKSGITLFTLFSVYLIASPLAVKKLKQV